MIWLGKHLVAMRATGGVGREGRWKTIQRHAWLNDGFRNKQRRLLELVDDESCAWKILVLEHGLI